MPGVREQVQLGAGQFFEVRTGRVLLHVPVVRPPNDQGRRLLLAQVGLVLVESRHAVLDVGEQVDHQIPARLHATSTTRCATGASISESSWSSEIVPKRRYPGWSVQLNFAVVSKSVRSVRRMGKDAHAWRTS